MNTGDRVMYQLEFVLIAGLTEVIGKEDFLDLITLQGTVTGTTDNNKVIVKWDDGVEIALPKEMLIKCTKEM